MDREALFISHANPEDNAFTLWLGSRLSAAGYQVWADILRLRGGQDWQRVLESALRQWSCKTLFVGTRHGARKQGVRNEIQIAHETGKRIGDPEFVIPLRLSQFDAPFLIAHAQYIDFEQSWAKGLAELLDALENTYRVPRARDPVSESVNRWRAVQLRNARKVLRVDDRLVSNWLRLTGVPKSLAFYDFRAGIRIFAAKEKIECSKWPLVPHHRGFLSFAELPELEGHFGPELPLIRVDSIETETFLKEGWGGERRIKRHDARNHFCNLLRQGLDRFLRHRGLQHYEMANGELAWWATTEAVPIQQLSFRWPNGLAGRRQLTGFSAKRKLYWHYGISQRPRVYPFPHIKLIGRVVFSEDGVAPLESVLRTHRHRRSFCRSWRNAKWRDMQLAFLYWLGNGEDELRIPMGSAAQLIVQLPTATEVAPFGVTAEGDGQAEFDSTDELDLVETEGFVADEEFLHGDVESPTESDDFIEI